MLICCLHSHWIVDLALEALKFRAGFTIHSAQKSFTDMHA